MTLEKNLEIYVGTTRQRTVSAISCFAIGAVTGVVLKDLPIHPEELKLTAPLAAYFGAARYASSGWDSKTQKINGIAAAVGTLLGYVIV